MKRFCLIGVKGIGKTHLAKSILTQIPQIVYIVGSEILKELAGEEFKKFDFLSTEKKQDYRISAIESFREIQNRTKKSILVDGHTVLYNPATDIVESVFTESDCLFYSDLILYDLKPNVVYQRRLNDKTKTRNLIIDLIEKELDYEKKEARRIAKEYNMKLHYLMDAKFELIQQKLINILSTG